MCAVYVTVFPLSIILTSVRYVIERSSIKTKSKQKPNLSGHMSCKKVRQYDPQVMLGIYPASYILLDFPLFIFKFLSRKYRKIIDIETVSGGDIVYIFPSIEHYPIVLAKSLNRLKTPEAQPA